MFLPGYEANPDVPVESVGLEYVDHMVGMGWGEMNTWVDFYARVMGFAQLISFDDKDISTEYTALMSKVMSNGNAHQVPHQRTGRRPQKIPNRGVHRLYEGAGVRIGGHLQHHRNRDQGSGAALSSTSSSTYYDTVLDRVGEIDEDLAPCANSASSSTAMTRILVANLHQARRRPPDHVLRNHPAQRRQILRENLKALFKAIEREQETRGTL